MYILVPVSVEVGLCELGFLWHYLSEDLTDLLNDCLSDLDFLLAELDYALDPFDAE